MLRAECQLSPGPNDELKMYDKATNLINDVGMKVFMNPVVKYMPDAGNEGLTFIAGLETSHTSFHGWELPDKSLMKYPGCTLIQFDMYTCGCMGENEIKTILAFIAEYKPKQLNVAVFDRSRFDTFFVPTIQINYNYKSKGNYLKFLNNLKIDYTTKYKKKFLKVA